MLPIDSHKVHEAGRKVGSGGEVGGEVGGCVQGVAPKDDKIKVVFG